jgi:allantoinase
MPWDVLIRGGEVVTPSGVSRLDIAIEGGTIVGLAPELSGPSRETIDASGLHVFPGVIDPHVHFNEPGRTDWEGFETGSAALAAGGGTCFFDMPLNSSPPVLDGAAFDAKRAAAERNSVTDFALWGGLTPNNLDRLEELAERGVVGFKAFMSNSGIDEFRTADDYTLYKGMSVAAKLGLIVAVHAENDSITTGLASEAMRQGRVAIRDYLASRPAIAELEAIQRAVLLAHETQCDLHIVHVSTINGVRAAKFGLDDATWGLPDHAYTITCETCPHYFLLCEEDVESIGPNAKCAPPVRSRHGAKLLIRALFNGEIDFLASDHSPAPASLKRGADFFKVWGGIAGVQTTLSSALTLHPRLPIEKIGVLTASNAAQRFGLSNKGKIKIGHDADLALIDLGAAYTLTREMLLDRHKLSPYLGREFRGRVRRTIVRGHTVFQDGRITAESFRGRLIKPSPRAATEGNGLDA